MRGVAETTRSPTFPISVLLGVQLSFTACCGQLADNSRSFIQDVIGLNLPFTPEERKLMTDTKTAPELIERFCDPIGTTPIMRGIQMPQAVLQRFDEVLKRLP